MQAVIVTGGKQYSVKEGDVIYVEKLNAEADAIVTFDQVLAVVDGENSKFGAPVVAGASVEAKDFCLIPDYPIPPLHASNFSIGLCAT